jgi:hypothetical protein
MLTKLGTTGQVLENSQIKNFMTIISTVLEFIYAEDRQTDRHGEANRSNFSTLYWAGIRKRPWS